MLNVWALDPLVAEAGMAKGACVELGRDDTGVVEGMNTTLGEEAFTAAFEVGQQMTLDEAVALALAKEA